MLLEALRSGDVALISDAGTPAIADPGAELVAAAHREGFRVVPVPGASSLVAAVSASGLVTGPFLFLGFLPRTALERRQLLGKVVVSGLPSVLFESPVRLVDTLLELQENCGNCGVVVAREITKLHEEVTSGRISDIARKYAENPPKGEVVIVLDAPEAAASGEEAPEAIIRRLLAQGLKPSRAAREVAAILNIPGAEAYDLVRKVGEE
jgi:16S rRNA (cytidine1402-2'-O)-methyltransferase